MFIKGMFVTYFFNIYILTVGFCASVMEEYLGDNG